MKLLVFLTSVIALCTRIIQSQLLSVPMNTIANIGQRVELECSTNVELPLRWDFAEVNSTQFESIYKNEVITASVLSRYRVNASIEGRYALVIDSVDMDHAGTYRCSNTPSGSDNEVTATAQLIVIDSGPGCSSNYIAAQNDGKEPIDRLISIWCSISYRGNGFPVFTWTAINAERIIVANTATSGNSRGSSIKASSIIEQLLPNDIGVTFQCRITVEIPRAGVYPWTYTLKISNISDIVDLYTWNYTIPGYGPRNLRIVEHEDRLECLADGSPTPTIKWKRVDTRSSVEGPDFILDDKVQTYQCTATNIFASERKNFTTTKGFNKESALSFSSIGLILITAILIVFGIFLFYIGLKQRRMSIAFEEVLEKSSAPVNKSSCQSQQTSKRFDTSPSTEEYAEVQMTGINETYCSLTAKPNADQPTEVYCELRAVDERGIKKSTKQSGK